MTTRAPLLLVTTPCAAQSPNDDEQHGTLMRLVHGRPSPLRDATVKLSCPPTQTASDDNHWTEACSAQLRVLAGGRAIGWRRSTSTFSSTRRRARASSRSCARC